MAEILIVDDSRVDRRLLEYMLKSNQHQVTSAINGQDAIEKLAARSFELIITDISMPVLDGLSLLTHIRNYATEEELPVIMLTSNGEEEDQMMAEEAGASGFLTKPVSSDKLTAMINRSLTGTRLQSRYLQKEW